MAPTIIFVPGLWVGRSAFDPVAAILRAAGLETDVAALGSTGRRSPGNPTMEDDIAGIRRVVESHVGQDKRVVLVLHSAGGFLASNAIEHLDAPSRAVAGKEGGVSRIVFLAGAILPAGAEHKPAPFGEVHDDGSMTCKSPGDLLMHDVPDPKRWLAALDVQPAAGWDGTVTLLPVPLQLQLAELAGSQVREVEAGHMLQLAKPAEVAAIIQEAAAA